MWQTLQRLNLARLSALVFAEFRSCRRLPRTWVFVAIACVFTLGQWIYLTEHYDFKALESPVYGLIGPRFTIAEMGGTMLLWFSIGVIFLTFDLRSRDIRDRMSEVLDTQPLSDFEMILGRLMGIVLLLSVPAVVVVLLMFGVGAIEDVFGLGWGTPMVGVSVFAFLVWDIIPNLLLWGSIAVLLAGLLKYRILVLPAALVLLGSVHVLLAVVPFSVSSVLSMHTGTSTYPSDLAPTFVTLNIVINRGVMLVIATTCIAVAALLQSRNQSTRAFTQHLIAGLVLTLAAVSFVGNTLIGNADSNERKVLMWTMIHKQNQSHASTDIRSILGTIDVRPGRSVSLDLTLTMETSSDASANAWLFSLNPGYRIKELKVNGVPSSGFEFEDGLLRVPRDYSIAHPQLRIVAKGKPDERFAYLDSTLDWKSLDSVGSSRLFYLGQENYIFHPNFVALMPGISWIPVSGSAYGTEQFETRPRDFYLLDVEVSVPKGWIVAGPGSRAELESSRRSTYRLRTQHPIPELALVCSKFERRSINVDGVEYELLLSRRHTKNLDAFDGSAPQIREWIGKRSNNANRSGLRYPYPRLTLVEVPASLRVYGGGWRMDSVFSAPGVQMIRESGFPVAPFGKRYRRNADYFQDRDLDIHKYVLNNVIEYFANDLHGGDPLTGIPKNFVDYQTAPTGNGATALRYITNELALRISTKSLGYFSVHTALARGTSVETNRFAFSPSTFEDSVGFRGFISDWRSEYAERSSAWELLEQTPLSSIDYTSDPQNSYHALLLKSERVSRAIVDTYGEELVAEFLSLLVEQFRGRSYTEDDFLQTALDVGMDMRAATGDWLNELGMAGFVVDDQRIERLADNDGEPVYQATFILKNDEPVPGSVKVSYEVQADESSFSYGPTIPSYAWVSASPLDAVHLRGNAAVRVAFLSKRPPKRVWLQPGLSLNRDPIRVDFPEVDHHTPTDTPALPYISQVDWEPEDIRGIIVDDLDDGFSIENPTFASRQSSIPSWLEYAATVPNQEFDRGLPIRRTSINNINRFNPLFGEVSLRLISERLRFWHRDTDPTSYGKYRKTYTSKHGRLDESRATFSTTLPTAGVWKLEYHVPEFLRTEIPNHWARSPSHSSNNQSAFYLGTHSIHVESREKQVEIEFEGGSSLPGWNELGTFELSNESVEVVLTEVSGGFAVADAIRWTPL